MPLTQLSHTINSKDGTGSGSLPFFPFRITFKLVPPTFWTIRVVDNVIKVGNCICSLFFTEEDSELFGEAIIIPYIIIYIYIYIWDHIYIYIYGIIYMYMGSYIHIWDHIYIYIYIYIYTYIYIYIYIYIYGIIIASPNSSLSSSVNKY